MSWLAGAAVLVAALALRMRSGAPVVTWPRAVGELKRRRTDRSVAAGLPALCEHVARSLRSGLSLRAALDDVHSAGLDGALAADVDRLRDRLHAGATVDEALDAWSAQRAEVGGVGLTVAALGLAAEVGGSMAEAVDGVADTLRSEVALAAEVRAMAAQAEASAALIAVLPAVFAAIAGAADPATLAFFVAEPIGVVCLAGGLSLDVAGFVWMRRISSGVR